MTIPPESVPELRHLYQRSLESRGMSDPSSCPDPEAILAVVEGRAPEDVRLQTLDHVAQCSGCRLELDLLRALGEARPPEGRRSTPWLAAAASVLVLFGAGYGLTRIGGDGTPVMRGPDAPLELLSPAPGAVDPGEIHFLWHAHPEAFEYVFEVVDGESRSLLTRVLTDTALVMSPEELPAGEGPLLWWVRANLRDGTQQASEPRILELPSR